MTTTLPYGSWPSPISARDLAEGGVGLGGPTDVDGDVWWLESVPAEGGRQAIVRESRREGGGEQPGAPRGEGSEHSGAAREVLLPAPWNARSRVHEYGGTPWIALPNPSAAEPRIAFVNFEDQRVYLMQAPGSEPTPLTPLGPEVPAAGGPSLRYACPVAWPMGDEVWWICEDHRGPVIERSVVAVPLDGSAAEDPSAMRRVTPAARFTAYPRISPDGTAIAWVTWAHPNMPWDGTDLWAARLVDGAVAGEIRHVAGGRSESVLQPEWLSQRELVFASDRTGWWNLYRATFPDPGASASGTDPVHPVPQHEVPVSPLYPAEEEFAGPMWGLGQTWYTVLPGRDLAVIHGGGSAQLGILDVDRGTLTDLELPYTSFSGLAAHDGALLTVAAGPAAFATVIEVRQAAPGGSAASVRAVRSSRESVPPAQALPVPEPITVEGDDGPVHAVLYRPRLEGYEGPAGEKPPLIAYVHGGPTSLTPAVLDMVAAYYTSRGLGYVAVNYGGSTGYGRAYRDRLRGQWGVVDVRDTVTVMEQLVASGEFDGARLGIEGGSAGGWTTLACLTRTDTFAAGVSSFGVAELTEFVKETHDFESRYIEGLVGPLPEAEALFAERAPLNHVDELSCPVLLLQGAEDKIVPPSQAERFRDALVAKHLPYAYLLFPGEQHGFRRSENIIAAREAALSFYGQVFGFASDAPLLELQRP